MTWYRYMYNLKRDMNDRDREGLLLGLRQLTMIASTENPKFHEVKYESAQVCEQVALVPM